LLDLAWRYDARGDRLSRRAADRWSAKRPNGPCGWWSGCWRS